MKRRTIVAGLLLGVVAWAGAQQAPYVVLRDGRRMEGVSVRVRPGDRSVVLMREDGQITLTRDQVTQVVGPRPDRLDEGMRALRAQRFDEAMAAFEPVTRESRFLTWDEHAWLGIARAQEGKGDNAAALRAYERLLEVNPRAEQRAEVRWGYYRAMAAAGRGDDVLPKLTELIRSGERADAARAYVMRGDLQVARERHEEGVLDYLRAVMFFRREAEIMPEAYLRVAETLEKMRDNRSREWYRRVVQEFPDSSQAAEARAKL